MNCVCRQSLSLFVVHLKHIFTLCTLEMTQASTGDIVLGTRRKQRTFLQLSRIMDPNYFGPFHTRVFRTNLRWLVGGFLLILTVCLNLMRRRTLSSASHSGSQWLLLATCPWGMSLP